LSGKENLPHRSARVGGKTGSYRGSLPAAQVAADGDPEGSPSDPVTTDPKGEAREARFGERRGQHAGSHRNGEPMEPDADRQGGVIALLKALVR
jgi:hypothetical protein